MERSSFFNSIGGDRRYKAEDWASYFASFIGNGYFPVPSTGLQVLAGDGMSIAIQPGRAWINGYFYTNEMEMVFPLETADGVLKRIDRVVIRWDLNARSITAQVKSSQPATNPVAPPLQRDADIWELCVADVFIRNGATAVSQADVTDQRLNPALCGVVAAVVNQIDTEGFNAQLQAWFKEYRLLSGAEYTALVAYVNNIKQLSDKEFEALKAWFENFKAQSTDDFNAWFNALQAILNENVAANLLSLIRGNTGKIEEEARERETAVATLLALTAKMSNDAFNGQMTELDDIAICSGTFNNAAAGWCSFSFPREFDGVPTVSIQPVNTEGFVMLNHITPKGFQYQLRVPETSVYYVGLANSSTPTHGGRTLMTGFTTTGEAVAISYIAVYDDNTNNN